MSKFFLSAVAILFATSFCMAETDSATAVTLVKGASEYLKKNGPEKSLTLFNDSTGQFVKGEFYVFAYDTLGVMRAHPRNPKLVGKDLLEVPDVDGKLFRKDIVSLAKTKGEGWVDYKYKNPNNNKTEPKTTYLFKNGGYILCCGIYKK